MHRSKHSFRLLLTLFCSAFLLCACAPRTRVPIDVVRYSNGALQGSRMLVVFLPGRGDDMTAFEENGFVETMRERGLDADVAAVDAHMGYYATGTVFTRIKEDIIEPAKAQGYETIWMVGASLGAYGALSYARQFPHDVAGLVLLGPYLGGRELLDEIAAAGGIEKWRPAVIRKNTQDEWDKGLWLWIKANTAQGRFHCGKDVFLGYGRGDRFSHEQDYFASLLPRERVIAIDGGHRWGTWKRIWALLLDKKIFTGPKGAASIAAERRRER